MKPDIELTCDDWARRMDAVKSHLAQIHKSIHSLAQIVEELSEEFIEVRDAYKEGV